MYKLLLSREAERFFQQCDKPTSKKLSRCFLALEKNPIAGNNIKALKGKFGGAYRYRIGDCRVVYAIDHGQVTVFAITIARRGDVYD